MTRRASDGRQDFEVDHLAELRGDDFEKFCEVLVMSEAYKRHVDPEIDGGAGRYKPDGGRDLLLTITKAPQKTKLEFQQAYYLTPLTEDPLVDKSRTRTVYSCKTGEKTWLDKALSNARKGAARAAEVLTEGGYFKLLINCPGKLDATVERGGAKKTPHEHLRDAYWERLKRTDPDAPDPGPRIQILDANTISTFVRSEVPGGPRFDHWLERFGLTTVLWNADQWRDHHMEDRNSPPEIVYDSARSDLSLKLREFINNDAANSQRIAFIVGKPGVGKTRMMIEFLGSEQAIAQRVRVALSPEDAIDAIDNRRLLQRHGDLVLVVDDCLGGEEAKRIASRCRVAMVENPRARVVIIIPAAFDAVKPDLSDSQAWALEPLDVEHTRKIVANEIGRPVTEAEVITIAGLSEGFPWFARLLAVEFKDMGRSPDGLREAVRWALASAREASPHDLEDVRLERARCLLAVSLTRAIDWTTLPLDAKDKLARAVGLRDGQQIMDTAGKCERRGILRRRLGWQYKYVTPQVLEREIIAWLLGPDGPDPGARQLAQLGEPYLADFIYTCTRLGLPGLLTGIADAALEDLRAAAPDLQQLDDTGLLGGRLFLVARCRPGSTALALRQIIETIDVFELRTRVIERRRLVLVLDLLASLSESFEDAERALFRLACFENESFANNATAVWSALFSVEFGDRLSLLDRRLSDADPAARGVALAGLDTLLAERTLRLISPNADERRHVSATGMQEIRILRLRGWSRLIDCFSDFAPSVASAAKRLALKHLRSAIRQGMGEQVLNMIGERVDDLSTNDRIGLREQLEAIRAYDSAYFAADSEQPGKLERAVAPRSFAESLRQRVGAWGPAALRDDENQLDDALARDGLEGETPLRSELAWLVTDQAPRAPVFARAIGRCDRDGTLFVDLRRLAKENPDSWMAPLLIARYLGGMASAGQRELAETFLRNLQAEQDGATLAALTLVELGATPEQMGWLEEKLRAGEIAITAIGELTRRTGWLSGIDNDDALSLAAAIASHGTTEHAATALELIVRRFVDREASDSVLDLLEQLLIRLAPITLQGMTDHYWELGAKLLLRAGKASRVAELAAVALSRVKGSSEYAWAVLHSVVEIDSAVAFEAVAREIGDLGAVENRLLSRLILHERRFDWPAEHVITWVGNDQRRARAAARMVRVVGDTLPDVHRDLLRRFGPHGIVAAEIALSLYSAEIEWSAERYRQQLEDARHWVDDPDPNVAAFARRLVDDLERNHERMSALEDDLRHQFGT